MPSWPRWFASPTSSVHAFIALRYESADGTVLARSLPRSIRNTASNRVLLRHLMRSQLLHATPTPEDVSRLFGTVIVTDPPTSTIYGAHIHPLSDTCPACHTDNGDTSSDQPMLPGLESIG